jgi:hypothetical protein
VVLLLGDKAELLQDGDAVVQADLSRMSPSLTRSSVVPVKRIVLPDAAGSEPTVIW